jgi:ATP-binding cassette subfamily F protein 3
MQLEKTAMSQQARRKEVLDFASRFGAKATKARQVQSRLKQLDKMESIEVRALPVKAKIRLPEPAKSSRSIVQMDDAHFSYGEKRVLNGLKLELQKGDRLGVVGQNGAGKSTLLKALAGELSPREGNVQFGQGVEIGYFAQHVAERLRNEDTVLEAIAQYAHSDVKRQDILDLAGSLLFGGDDVNKKISVLSGGEKSRVALGQILLKRASCLLLDEPTNHLDFDTVEALTQALEQYPGTVVIVSHDRGFVRRTASKILEIRSGQAEFYPGTYDEYVWSVQKGALSERNEMSAQSENRSGSTSSVAVPESASKPVKVNFKERKKHLEKEQRQFEKEMARIESEIDKLNASIIEMNERLASSSGTQAAELARKINEEQVMVHRLEETYMDLLEKHTEAIAELAAMG